MGKNNKAKAKGFKRVISKFKRLVTEDDNYYDPDAAILKPISRKPQEQNQVVLGINEELKPQTEPISIMEDFEDFQANNSLVVDDLIKNVSQSLSMSVSTSMSLSAEHFDSDSVSTSESSLQDSLWENDSLETYSLDSSSHIIDQSDSESELVLEDESLSASISASESLSESEYWSIFESESLSISESDSLYESGWLSASISASESLSESEYWSIFESESLSISESDSLYESEWLSASISASESLSESISWESTIPFGRSFYL